MTFGDVVRELKLGAQAARSGWVDQVIYLQRPVVRTIGEQSDELAVIVLRVDFERVLPEVQVWSAPHADLLATDWQLVRADGTRYEVEPR